MSNFSNLQFPPELKVNILPDKIEVDLPEPIPGDIKKQLVTKNIITKQNKTEKTLTIKGPSPELNQEGLLMILEGMNLFHPQPFELSILQALDSTITEETTMDELLEKGINIEKFLSFKPGEIPYPEIDCFTEEMTNVSPITLDLLIAIYAPNDDQHYIDDYLFDKDSIDPFILRLSMPAELPVCVKREDEHSFQISFSNYAAYTATEIREQFDLCIEYLTSIPVPQLKIQKCDPIELDYYDKMNDAVDAYIAVAELPGCEDDDMVNSIVVAFPLPGQKLNTQQINALFQKCFEDHRLVYCKKCGCLYNHNEVNSECINPAHVGKQMRFSDDEFERVEFDNECDEVVKYVKYSCCGTVDIEEPCLHATVNPQDPHHALDESKQSPSLMIGYPKKRLQVVL